jgi:nucleoside-diphosphate-sugar epimerase
LLDEAGREVRGRRILVTGASGFVGGHLCRTLVSLEAVVCGLSRSPDVSRLPDGVTPIVGDLRGAEETERAVREAEPEIIFHLAAVVTARPDRDLVVPTFAANAAGTVHLLAAADRVGCQRVILVSSSEASAGDAGGTAGSPYAAAKLASEAYGRMFHSLYGLPVLCVRPFLIYGPGQGAAKLIPYTILSLLRGEAPRLTRGDRVCDPVHVEDVVLGLLMASRAPASVLGARVDLGCGRAVTIRELVSAVVKVLGATVRPVFGAAPERPLEPSSVADVELARTLLGWTPRWSLEEGLRDTVAWYRDHAMAGQLA